MATALLWTLLFTTHNLGTIAGLNYIKVCPDSASTDTSIINTIPLTQTTIKSFVFAVKACSNVCLTLAENSTTLLRKHTITIGRKVTSDNEISSIATCYSYGCSFESVFTNDILSCTSFKWYWISWYIDVTFGLGSTIYENVIISKDLSAHFVVNYIGIREGEWIFRADQSSFEIRDAVKCTYQTTAETDEMKTNPVSSHTYQLTSLTTSGYSGSTHLKCSCSCKSRKYKFFDKMKISKEDVKTVFANELQVLTNSIKIDRNRTNKCLSKKVSAQDDRMSSQSVGWVAAFIISLLPMSVLTIDILNYRERKQIK